MGKHYLLPIALSEVNEWRLWGGGGGGGLKNLVHVFINNHLFLFQILATCMQYVMNQTSWI